MTFVPLFCQSHHSPRGVAAPADLVRRARSLDYTTLGLCDEATLAGFLEFDEACHAQGIRPVFGCRLLMEGFVLREESFPVDFLIETEQGYRNLVRLLTMYHNRGETEARPLAPGEMRELLQGLVAVIPPEGELTRLIALRDRRRTEDYLKRALELFQASLVFGIDSPRMEHASLIRRMARFLNVRAMATAPVQYPEPGDAAAEVFLATPSQAPGRSWQPPGDLKELPALWPEVDILARWRGEVEELPHEAGNIARRCTWRPGCIRRAFPTLDLERGFDPNSYLFDLVIRGATQRYGEITEARKQRINRELEDIKAGNLAAYLLLCHQITEALDQKAISRGVGRGRMVSSMIAYCLGISRIDPLKYNLVAKSLMVEGENYPPISIEVPRGGVPRLLAWLRETYGEDHLVEIGRIQEIRREQLINDLAQWAGMTEDERRLAHREKARQRSAGAAQRLGELAESARSRRWRDPAFLGDLAVRLAPRPRGWVGQGDRYALSGDPLDCVLPRMRSLQNRPVSGLEERAVDRLGLARLVFVPHGLLDILDQAMKAARAQNPALDFRTIPLEDRATYELLGRGDTSGIPPLEGVTLRCLLRRTPPGNLLQLLRIKTDARPRGDGERQPEVSDELPDVLLSYQCAYLKANYPLAFYAAAIGTAIEQHENPAALVREARRAGFDIHSPDINLSDWGTTVQGGIIRLGLSTVRNFGRKAWENVEAVRSGGNFTSLTNFCERVDLRLINLKILRSLIAAGAMDCLEDNRARMDGVVQRLQRQLREREAEAERSKSQATLFDLQEWEEADPATATEGEPADDWNLWEKLQREYEALGFHLSIDPVQRYKIALSHLAPLTIDTLAARHVGRMIRLSGLTGKVERTSPLIEREGDLLMELEGLPVLIPQPLAAVSDYCLAPATEVLLAGRLLRAKGYLILEAEGIWRLADLEDQATKVGTIELILDGENRQTLKLLIDLLRRYKGNTAVRLSGYGERQGWTYRRLAGLKVFFCSPLFQGLCKILPPEAIKLYGTAGEPLLVKATPVTDDPDGHEEKNHAAIISPDPTR